MWTSCGATFLSPACSLVENVGSCSFPDLTTEPRPLRADSTIETSGYNAPTFGDTDGDGDLDLVMGVLGGAYNPNTTTADNLFHFMQGDDGSFRLDTRRLITQIDVGSESIPSLIDLDADGDLDLLLGNRIDPSELDTLHLYRFENVGTPTAPAFRSAGPLEIDGAYHNAPAFGDLDGDGDLDLLLGTWRDELRYLENTGSRSVPEFELVNPALVELSRGSNATPTLGDMDNDGDLDLLVGESAGTLGLYINTGTESVVQFDLTDDRYLDLDIGRRSFPKLIDFDGDGDLDLAIGTQEAGVVYFENRGDASDPSFVETESPFPAPEDLPLLVTPSLGDIDGDGDADLVTGGMGGGAYYFERR